MDWIVNDGLYHRFLKWCLKCGNILECEIAMLPERRQCKKVIAWSGDFGMEQYVSWSLSSEELTFDIIWEKFEEFCMPQPRLLWIGILPETTKILHRGIFLFFLKDEDLASKTINDNNIDLDKFPQARSGSLQRRWRVLRQLPGISSKWQVTPRQLRLMSWGTSAQTSQQRSTRKEVFCEA